MSGSEAEAILFGLALGDALGYPVEFLQLKDIQQHYGAKGIQEARHLPFIVMIPR